MSAKPLAFVMEQTLGSVTHYLNLRAQEGLAPPGSLRWLPVEYREGRLPWTLTGSLSARRQLAPLIEQVGGVFIHTTTIAPLSTDLFFRIPTVLSSDGTPLNKREMRDAYGLRAEGRLAELAKRQLYRQVFRRAAAFVAWSTWTKQSFVQDYGCREEDVAVIPPGVDLTEFDAGQRDHELPRILFVGGDFGRKGGDLLLEVFRRRLRGKAELHLVTRSDVAPEPGVFVYRNVNANSLALRELYRSSDVFTLPTRADCYSLVCMEALAAGLPIVATRVGGIPDMILEGETGHLVEVDDAQVLGDALESLVLDRAQRQKMGEASRAVAVARFDVKLNAARLFEFVRSRC